MHRIYKCMILFLWFICLNCLWFVKPLSENLSYLGNGLHMRSYVLLWAITCAMCFYIFTMKWIKNIQYTHKAGKILLLLCCLGMVISVCLPYAPYEYAELSKWHVRLAMLSTTLYFIFYIHFKKAIFYYSKRRLNPIYILLFLIYSYMYCMEVYLLYLKSAFLWQWSFIYMFKFFIVKKRIHHDISS